MTEEKWIITWKDQTKGICGRSKFFFDRSSALSLVEELNLEFPHIEHVAEIVAEPPAVAMEPEPRPALSNGVACDAGVVS